MLNKLKESGEAPGWYTDESWQTVSRGYLLDGETPKDMYMRVANSVSKYLKKPKLKQKFFDLMWNNYLCPSTPVLANAGTNRGLVISCNTSHVPDSMYGIMDKAQELAMLAKHGAGVGMYLGELRARGSAVKGTGGISDGVTAWARIYDGVSHSVNQGGVRRGSTALYLPIEHGDFDEFIDIRRPNGDSNTRCLNVHHAVTITDEFMHSLDAGNQINRAKWSKLIRTRFETGEPYLLFVDTVNKANPLCYKDQGLKVVSSNLCNEIVLHTDPDHTFVCCLSSMNLARWEEWKDTDAVELAIWFLDGVLEEYTDKASNIRGFESAIRFAKKSRALGLGVLGWHTLLQSKFLPFDSFDSMMLNANIFRTMQQKTQSATKALALEYGEPEWCKGYGIRNTHTMAVAPTASNSLISGGISPGIEPIAANCFVQNSAKGTFVRKNNELEKLLELLGKNTQSVWNQINKDGGSVQNLKFLSEDNKKVFLSAKELNQFSIIKQAAQRAPFIDQSQSVNLFFATNADPRYISDVHLEAWKLGVKGLYYCRTESVLRADLASRSKDECAACES